MSVLQHILYNNFGFKNYKFNLKQGLKPVIIQRAIQ